MRPGEVSTYELSVQNMALKHFILPDMYFIANLFFPLWPTNPQPLTHPTTNPRDYLGEDTKRGEGGLIKVKKQVDLKKSIPGDLKHL